MPVLADIPGNIAIVTITIVLVVGVVVMMAIQEFSDHHSDIRNDREELK